MAEVSLEKRKVPDSSDGSKNHGESSRKKSRSSSDGRSSSRKSHDLERKKVQQYKEDKLRARKDHTRMILEQQAQAKRRVLLGKKSEFVCAMEFRNSLPDLPFDPKFLTYPHEPERLIKYKPNSLEKDYLHEMQFEPNLGLAIDIIDPANYEALPEKVELEPEEKKILYMRDDNDADVRKKGKVRPAVTWLRRTEYMGNDLFDSVHKFKNIEQINAETESKKRKEAGEQVVQGLKEQAIASFDYLSNDKKIVHPNNKKLKIKKVWDVFPDALLSGCDFSLLAFDVLPSKDMKGADVEKRQAKALLRDAQQVEGMGRIKSLSASLLIPKFEKEERDEAHKDEEYYSYFRDYQMNKNNATGHEDQFIFVINPDANDVTYCRYNSRWELKKSKPKDDDSRRRGAYVFRRPFSEEEKLEQDKRIRQCGGKFDESLNSVDSKNDEHANDEGGPSDEEKEKKNKDDASPDVSEASSGSDSD